MICIYPCNSVKDIVYYWKIITSTTTTTPLSLCWDTPDGPAYITLTFADVLSPSRSQANCNHLASSTVIIVSNEYASNSLWPSDAIWQHRSGSKLDQVMACCPRAPSHYLNQYWIINLAFASVVRIVLKESTIIWQRMVVHLANKRFLSPIKYRL